MSLECRGQSSQISTAQSRPAIGPAKRNPRAKLLRPVRRAAMFDDASGDDASLSIATLSIIVIDVLFLPANFYRRIRKVKWNWLHFGGSRVGYLAGGRHQKPVVGRALDRVIHEMEDFALIVQVVGSWSADQVNPRERAIVLPGRRRSGLRRHTLAYRCAAFIVICTSGSRLAHAEPAQVVTPIELFEPENADGIRVSPGFILFPEATADVTYDSNIFNVDGDETDDTYLSLRPALTLGSDFSRHAVKLEGRAELRRYLDSARENSNQWGVRATSLLDLGQGIDIETVAGIRRGIEGRGTLGDVFLTDEPVAFTEKQVGVTVSRTGRRLELSATGGLLRRDYFDTLVDGEPVDLSIRDVTIRTATVRADLGVSARTKIFTEVGGNQIDFENLSVPPLDSSGLSVLAGVTHQVTSLLDVEAAVGYIYQDFDNPVVQSASEFNYRLGATWTPKPEWRMTASASRIVDASRTQESPAIITNDFRLGAERAIGDRILVRAEAVYAEDDYRGTLRLDQRFNASASTTYRLTENVSLSARVAYRDQNGGTFGRSFEGYSGAVGVRMVW